MTKKIYQLVFSGEGAVVARGAFPDFEVATQPPTTVIRGVVGDPAALEEAISRILGLGLELLEVRNLGDAENGPPPADPEAEQ